MSSGVVPAVPVSVPKQKLRIIGNIKRNNALVPGFRLKRRSRLQFCVYLYKFEHMFLLFLIAASSGLHLATNFFGCFCIWLPAHVCHTTRLGWDKMRCINDLCMAQNQSTTVWCKLSADFTKKKKNLHITSAWIFPSYFKH